VAGVENLRSTPDSSRKARRNRRISVRANAASETRRATQTHGEGNETDVPDVVLVTAISPPRLVALATAIPTRLPRSDRTAAHVTRLRARASVTRVAAEGPGWVTALLAAPYAGPGAKPEGIPGPGPGSGAAVVAPGLAAPHDGQYVPTAGSGFPQKAQYCADTCDEMELPGLKFLGTTSADEQAPPSSRSAVES